MKNKSRLMFLLKLIFVSLIIILVLLVLFLYKTIIGNRESKPKLNTKTIEKSYSVDDINTLVFDFKNYEVKYYITKNDLMVIKQTGKVNKFYIDEIREHSKITYRESVSNIFDRKVYRVYIPKSYLGKLKIINGFRNIAITNLDNVILDNNSGNIKIKNVNDIYVKNVSGNIYVNGDTSSIDISSTTGDIIINELNGACNIETITGDINIKRFDVNSPSNIETTSGNIDIKIGKDSNCSLVYNKKSMHKISKKKCVDGINELKIKNVTGNINIK